MSGAKPDTWMPIFWGDYTRDTAHLSAAEHGAYLMLIGHYWTSGKPLPNDDDRLARIARMTPREWKKTKPVLAEFFEITEQSWAHNRVERELSLARSRTERKAEAGRKGAERRWQSDPSANGKTDGNPNGTAMAQPSDSQRQTPWQTDAQSHSHSQPPKDKASSSGSKSVGQRRLTQMPDDFTMPAEWRLVPQCQGWSDQKIDKVAAAFGEFYQNGRGANQKFRDWRRAWNNWCAKEREFARERGEADTATDPHFKPNPEVDRKANLLLFRDTGKWRPDWGDPPTDEEMSQL